MTESTVSAYWTARLRELIGATVKCWEAVPDSFSASKRVKVAMDALPSALADSDAKVINAARRLSVAATRYSGGQAVGQRTAASANRRNAERIEHARPQPLLS